MISRFLQRSPALGGSCRRSLITQPTVLNQGEHCVPIFLNPPSSPDLAFGAALRSKCASKGVDLDYVDLRMFQIKQDNYEFEPPALPRESSSCWGYIWGNRFVKNKVLLETLKPEDDYLRGYLTQLTEEYSRKMKIHYPSVDIESRKAKQLAALKSTSQAFDTYYMEAKLDALSDFIASDTDAYLNLYKNNSYISNYDDGDTFGYDIPKEMEAKLEGLMKFDWDKDSANVDLGPYVQIITQLTDSVSPKLAKMNPTLGASMKSFLAGCMGGSTAELQEVASMLTTTSASLVGSCPEKVSDAVTIVLSALKPAGALKAEDAAAVVCAFRGIANPTEAALLKGKSDADVAAAFKDVSEARLSALVTCANFSKGITEQNVGALIVSGLFANCPSLFSQFCVDSANVSAFTSANAGAFDAIATSVAALSPVQAEVQKNMAAAAAAVAKHLGSIGIDKAGVEAATKALPGIMLSCGTASTPWMAKAAATAAKKATGLDLVEANTLAAVFANPAVSSTPAMKMYEAMFGSSAVKGVAMACSKGTYADNLGAALADCLLTSGSATPAQAEMISSKIGAVAEVKTFVAGASKALDKYTAVDEAMLSVTWVVEPMSIPTLMMAYQSLPHPSFYNVNAY